MSFSSEIKNEIISNTANEDCCALAELSGLLATGGSLYIAQGRLGVRFSNENAAVSRHAFSLVKRVAGVKCAVSAVRRAHLQKTNVYILDIDDAEAARDILDKTRITSGGFDFLHEPPDRILQKDCCKRAYLRGVFLGGGTMADPGKAYHLDIACADEQYAGRLCDYINLFGLNAKTVSRKDKFVVYLKSIDSIVDLLSLIGASAGVFHIENTRILKGIHNDVNRAMNCETANGEKALSAAEAHQRDINYLIENDRFRHLSKPLRESAELRLEYPEATLLELGQLHSPAQSKSCMNHRMAKIHAIAEELRHAKGDMT